MPRAAPYTEAKYLELWYAAANSFRGVVIRTEPDQIVLVMQQLYQARKYADDPQLAGISIVKSPLIPGELWLIKKEQPVAKDKSGPSEAHG